MNTPSQLPILTKSLERLSWIEEDEDDFKKHISFEELLSMSDYNIYKYLVSISFDQRLIDKYHKKWQLGYNIYLMLLDIENKPVYQSKIDKMERMMELLI